MELGHNSRQNKKNSIERSGRKIQTKSNKSSKFCVVVMWVSANKSIWIDQLLGTFWLTSLRPSVWFKTQELWHSDRSFVFNMRLFLSVVFRKQVENNQGRLYARDYKTLAETWLLKISHKPNLIIVLLHIERRKKWK